MSFFHGPRRMKNLGVISVCPHCNNMAAVHHLHNTANVHPGSHMPGSERFECTECRYTYSRAEALDAGHQYKLDKGIPG